MTNEQLLKQVWKDYRTELEQEAYEVLEELALLMRANRMKIVRMEKQGDDTTDEEYLQDKLNVYTKLIITGKITPEIGRNVIYSILANQ